ncbi:hypothetical protein FRAHR75_280008 [Frankia sp. Hr75.2]|nr:hypothetical protein FRAHR75_280008 [Frankia sp. Hr75.2]
MGDHSRVGASEYAERVNAAARLLEAQLAPESADPPGHRAWTANPVECSPYEVTPCHTDSEMPMLSAG